MTTSLYCPHTSPEPAATAWWVALAASLQVDVWFGHNRHTNPLAGVGYAAGRGHRTGVGQGVSLIPTLTPHSCAADLSGLHRLTGRRVRAYFSPGYPALQQLTHGSTWKQPLRHTRDFLLRLRALLDEHGLTPHTELGLGVLQPRMAHLAGSLADGALTWLVAAPRIRDILRPALESGARSAGRRAPTLVATLHTTADDTTPLHRQAGTYLAGHLAAPHYRRLLTAQGLALHGDTDTDGDALVQAGLFVPPGQVGPARDRLLEAGADEVALVLHAAGTVEQAHQAWRRSLSCPSATEPALV